MGPLMATENRRQTLLREIGIQSWFPRTALPGAGTSHDIDWVTGIEPQPETVTEAAGAQAAVAAPAAAGDQIPASLRAALRQAPAPDTAPEARKPAAPVDNAPSVAQTPTSTQSPAAAEAPALTDEPALEFAFSWFNVDKRLSVLAMLPAGADRLSGPCRQMLQRILLALMPQAQSTDWHEHTFHWPFSGDLGLPTGQQAARQAVDGFVARRLREQPSAMVLILADQTPPFLYSDVAGSGEDHDGKLSVHRQFGFTMLRTHSLHAMEANGELKRSAWQAMQTLRDRLNRGAE
ncbi:hypothetical protein LCGC14_0007990 [marine sediment metagenome]|uniref:Uncharacterized protein n=2 Tax=root TaxID=1 RepID=A0A0F9YKP2_9ZZZZ